MKKIIIREADGKLLAHIDSIMPKFITEYKENIIASFDVSECFIHIQ